MSERVVIATEDDQDCVLCEWCDGSEGSCDENNEWIPCFFCDGEGVFWEPHKGMAG
jgi:hypothetical protein